MSRIAPITLDQTDAATAATLKAAQAKLGLLPNMFATMAHAPTLLNGYLQFAETLGGGRLTAKQREMIALAVAQENSCEYCLSAHAALGKGAGLNAEAIAHAQQGYAQDALDAALLIFAKAITQHRGEVTDSDFSQAQLSGLDEGLMMEVVANVALNVLTNYTNRLAATEVDFPRVALLKAA
ncbi:MAG: carboxymuconolactone decarboxylase family protein [Sedimenticola sp.]|nr:carboxymuconolactone decarboxylase family protein [Sedimenticola sp.]